MGDHFGHPRGVHTIAMSGGGGGRVEGGGEGGGGASGASRRGWPGWASRGGRLVWANMRGLPGYRGVGSLLGKIRYSSIVLNGPRGHQVCSTIVLLLRD